jgi:hypothetical protein
MRPRYEEPEDRANEYTALAKFAATWDVFIGPRNTETGLTLLQNKQGVPIIFVETKCRRNTSYKYPSLKISTKKIKHAQQVWTKSRVPTVLLIQFTDRLMFTKLYPLKKPFPTTMWGRADRGDPYDIEEAVEIHIGKFREIM